MLIVYRGIKYDKHFKNNSIKNYFNIDRYAEVRLMKIIDNGDEMDKLLNRVL